MKKMLKIKMGALDLNKHAIPRSATRL